MDINWMINHKKSVNKRIKDAKRGLNLSNVHYVDDHLEKHVIHIVFKNDPGDY